MPIEIARFAVYDINYLVTSTGVEITVFTFEPCHLWLRYTTKEPQEHLVPVIKRGLATHQHKRFCFVVYKDLEQNEAGDTLTHTFTIEPWPHCQTRYFYFYGSIGGDPSPSTSAIFSYHRVYTAPPPPIVFEWDIKWGSTKYRTFTYTQWELSDFVAISNHTVTEIQLWLSKYGNPLPGQLRLYPVDVLNFPTGPAYFIVSFDWNDLPTYPDFGLKTIAVPTTNLVSGNHYSVSLALDPPWVYRSYGRWHRGSSGNKVSSQHQRWSTDQGATWTGHITPYWCNYSIFGNPL